MQMYVGDHYVELGASADGGEEVTTSGTVNPFSAGTYTVTYTATDGAGNVGTATREVTFTGNIHTFQKSDVVQSRPFAG